MEFIDRTNPKLLIADKGKLLRAVNDVFIPAKYDSQGNIIEEEHKPYYSSIIFLADNIDTSKINELYVEEEIEKE